MDHLFRKVVVSLDIYFSPVDKNFEISLQILIEN